MAKHILDGRTEPGYVAALPGIHDALRFTFRRALGWENAQIRREPLGLKPKEAEYQWAKFIRAHLASWDARDAKDEMLPLSDDNVYALNPALQEAVLGIVMSQRASDPEPHEDPAAPPAIPDPANAEQADAKN